MKFPVLHRLLLAAAVASALVAQDAPITGPVSGFVFDSQEHSLRVVAGVPGAAYLAGSVVSEIDAASVSPDGRLAIVAKQGRLALMTIATGAVAPLGEFASAELFAWSADSQAVAVAGSKLALFRNGQPAALAPFEGTATALALEVTGDAVIVATKGAVSRVSAEGVTLIAPVGNPSAVTIGAQVLYVADRDRAEVLAIRNWASAPEISIAAAGLVEPVGIGLSQDSRSLLIADSGSRSVLSVNPASGESLGRLELDFAPTQLAPFGRNLFSLSSRVGGGDPLQLLDAGRLASYFVPTQDLSHQAAAALEE